MTDKPSTWQKTQAKVMVMIVKIVGHPDLDDEARKVLFECGARLHNAQTEDKLALANLVDALFAQADRLEIAKSSPAVRAAVDRLLGRKA
jgi:predicted metalloendopeptidase